jgi:hypothetical protein
MAVGYINPEDTTMEWELHKQWFVWPHGIKVKLSPFGDVWALWMDLGKSQTSDTDIYIAGV